MPFCSLRSPRYNDDARYNAHYHYVVVIGDNTFWGPFQRTTTTTTTRFDIIRAFGWFLLFFFLFLYTPPRSSHLRKTSLSPAARARRRSPSRVFRERADSEFSKPWRIVAAAFRFCSHDAYDTRQTHVVYNT